MKTADQVLTEHEDANEMHFHQVDREWIIKAMEEFALAHEAVENAKLKLRLNVIHRKLNEYYQRPPNNVKEDTEWVEIQ